MLPKILSAIPGPKSLELGTALHRWECRNITGVDENGPIFWQRAAGTNVWDVDGNRFLDFTSAFGVAGLGHTAPAIRDALVNQASDLLHAMGDVHPAAAKADLCQRLSEVTFERWGAGVGKSILGNSGFEAVEAALKTSLLHSGKPGVIAFTGGYHGLGFGALATGGIPFFTQPFRAQLKEFTTRVSYPHCRRCPFGVAEGYRLGDATFPNCSSSCLAAVHDEIEKTIRRKEIGCILVEPVQARGGVVIPPLDFMRILREICDTHKILLIADEIYTGFNRTGALFACDHFGVVPDLICLGKALTGGFPLSACVGRSDIMDAWPLSQGEALHTSTFLGNPLGCSMALAALREHLESSCGARVRESGAQLKAGLQRIQSPRLGHLRGVGLMIGLEIVRSDGSPDPSLALQMVRSGLKDGLLLLADSPAGNVIALAPPFAIETEEIDFLVGRLQEYFTLLPGSIS